MNDKVKSFKVGDNVKIISAPIVENNKAGQLSINDTIGMTTQVRDVYQNGIRNILCLGGGVFNYYSPENLELQSNEQ